MKSWASVWKLNIKNEQQVYVIGICFLFLILIYITIFVIFFFFYEYLWKTLCIYLWNSSLMEISCQIKFTHRNLEWLAQRKFFLMEPCWGKLYFRVIGQNSLSAWRNFSETPVRRKIFNFILTTNTWRFFFRSYLTFKKKIKLCTMMPTSSTMYSHVLLIFCCFHRHYLKWLNIRTLNRASIDFCSLNVAKIMKLGSLVKFVSTKI